MKELVQDFCLSTALLIMWGLGWSEAADKPKPSVFIEPGIVRCTPEASKAKLRVIRASDGKIVLVDYCAAAEDSHYSEIEKRPGERK